MQKLVSCLLLFLSILLLTASLIPVLTGWLEDTSPFYSTSVSPTNTNVTITASQLDVSVVAATPTSLYAKAYCVMDQETGRVLLGKNESLRLPMASTTKIMTCILALESGQLEDIVEVSSYAASMPDVQLNIKEGEQYRLKDLLYSLMLESHNDTAVAIAQHLGGSVEGFARMMNDKARELGCENTNFVTPNGLDDENHYTTARELCLIGAYAIENQEFQEIIATQSYQFQELSGKRSFTLNNHDAFLQQYSGALGIKTGFTGNAGYCFCGAARQKGRTLITAVLACGWPPNKSYKWSDTKKLMDYGFQGFQTKEIPLLTDTATLSVEHGQSSELTLMRSENYLNDLTLPLKADDTVTITKELPETLSAPVRSGDIVGYENYYLNGECVRQVPLIAGDDILEVDFPYLLEICWKLLSLAKT